VGRSFDAQVAAARKEMQKRRAEMEREGTAGGAPAGRVPVPSGASKDEDFGHVVMTDSIGMRSVTIYSNGYVRVGLLGSGQIEKLISIEYSANIQKKSAAGRGAAMVLTGGLNLVGSKHRGDVWLTIVTDRDAYTLHADPPRPVVIRAAQKLAAAGQGVLARLEAEQAARAHAAPAPASTRAPTEQRSVTDRLKELTKLHEQGMVSDDEFKELRSNLLKEL